MKIPHYWIVLDDSASMGSFDDRVRRIHRAITENLSTSSRKTWTTSSGHGMERFDVLSDRKIGDGGGDGLRRLCVYADTYVDDRADFIIYLTDGQACFDGAVIAYIEREHIVLVDITDERWDTDHKTHQSVVRLRSFVRRECDDDYCECPGDICEYGDTCLESLHGGRQPFYPNWVSQTSPFRKNENASLTGYAELDELRQKLTGSALDDLSRVRQIRSDIIAARKLEGVKRNGFALDLFKEARKAGLDDIANSIASEFFQVPDLVERARFAHIQVQEGHMTAHITTTVSLKVAQMQRATVSDFKTLIAEVERVGGTDDSYVDLDHLHRSGRFDAVIVTAVEVTEPELDPRVQCALAIEDNDTRLRALLDLYRNGPSSLHKQIEPHLTSKKKDEPKKATARPRRPKN